LPIFAPGEQSSDPKKFSDFNDLATKSTLGSEGIKRQVCSVVDAVIEKHLANFRQQEKIVQKVRVAARGR
jgi:putative DNA primase/helicase